MTRPNPIPLQTRVVFDICQGLATGQGVIVAAQFDDGWLYRLDVIEANGPVDGERNDRGELWAWDFEVDPLGDAAPDERTAN